MKCEKAQMLMLDHLYGDLESRKQQAFLRHLAMCATCSEEFESHRATMSTFGKLDMEHPPQQLSERIVSMAARDIKQRRPVHEATAWYWKPAFAATAAVALAIISFVYYLPLERESRVASPAAKRARIAMYKGGEKVVSPEDAVFEGDGGSKHPQAISEMRTDADKEQKEQEGTADEVSLEKNLEGEYRETARMMLAEPPRSETLRVENEYGNHLTSQGGRSSSEKVLKDSFAPRKVKEEDTASSMYGAGSAAPLPPSPASKPTGIPPEAMWMAAEEPLDIREGQLRGAPATPVESVRDELEKGNLYFGKRDFKKAATSYQKVLSLSPKSERAIDVMFNLGRSYQELALFDQAIFVYEEIIGNHPDFVSLADVFMATGECYLAMGRMEEALGTFEIVREQYPDRREIAVQKIHEVISQQGVPKETGQSPQADSEPAEPE